MGWTNTQAETIVGLAFTYLTTTVLFSTGSAVTWAADSTFDSFTDLNVHAPAGINFDGVRLEKDGTGLSINGDHVLVDGGGGDVGIVSPHGVVWDGTLRLDRQDDDLTIGGRPIMTATAIEYNAVATIDVNSSTTYVNVVNATLNFTKRATDTAIIVLVNTSCYTNNAGDVAQFGVRVAGTDYDIGRMHFSAINDHKGISGTAITANGIAPGTYNVRLRWKRLVGSGDLGQNTYDINNIFVWEG